MTDSRTFYLAHDAARRAVGAFAMTAPQGWRVTFSEPRRSLDQNAKFHAICHKLDGRPYAGKPRDAAAWKVLFVSGHSAATKGGMPELVGGLEGELVSIRESTATMAKSRGSSLIEYTLAWCAHEGIDVREVAHDV